MPSSPETPPAPAPTATSARRLRRWAWGLGGGLLVLALLLVGGVAWLGRSETGSGWLLARMPGLQLDGLQGSLLGDELSAERLQLDIAGARLELKRVRLTGLDWGWQRPTAPQAPWLHVSLANLSAEQAVWRSAPSPTAATPSTPPASLRLPVALTLAAGRVDALQIDDLPPLSGVQLRGLALGADHGARHTVQSLALRSERLLADTEASIDTDAPLALKLASRLQSLEGAAMPWRATVALDGPLAELKATARLSSDDPKGPALDADATLKPFAAWPLGALNLRTRDLDLAALHAGLPATRLRGEARLTSTGLDAPADAEVALDNDAPGRWDEQRLPVRRLRLQARGTVQALGELQFRQIALDLGGTAAGGQLRGDGRLHLAGGEQALSLALTLDGLRPAALDQRLPAMTLGGPLTVALTGLPLLSEAAPPASAPASASTPASATAPTSSAPPMWRAALEGRLQGRLEGSGTTSPTVRLNWQAKADAQQFELTEAEASAGDAQARASGRLSYGTGPLGWLAKAELKDFDPLLWWPAAEVPGSRGARRLNATLDSEGTWDASARPGAASDWRASLRGLAGRLSLALAPSQWGGLPLQGELAATRNAAGSATARGRLDTSGNRVTLDARDDGRAGQADLTLEAPSLAALAPWWAAAPADSAWAWLPSRGRLQGKAGARWAADGAPQWQAELNASGLQHPRWQGERLQGQAEGGGLGDGPLKLQLAGEGLVWEEQAKLDSLRADLQGSLREHQLSLRVSSPIRPPVWFEQVLGARVGSGSRLALTASGRWQPADAKKGVLSAGRWDGRFSELQGRAGDGSGQPWLAARDLQLGLAWGDALNLIDARAEPGRLELPGTAVRWSEASYRAGAASGAPGRLSLQAQIEAFELAPLLARAQPELGWKGDLVLGGEVRLLAAERFDADVVFERQRGDLSVADDVRDSATPRRALGLSDLRLGLAAHNGTWHFTIGLAGQQLGDMVGVASAHTTPQARWPGREAPLDGVFQLNVAQLGAWGAWVPPGWRLGGEVKGAATLGGRWGAPEISGRLSGRKLEVRNALQGVQFTEGAVDLSLQGDLAKLERFEWRGGEGWLRVTGEGQLGAQPQANLVLLAERLRVLGRIDRRVVASGQATLALRPRSARLAGQVRLDEGLIDFSRGGAPTLDDDVRVRDPEQLRAEAAAAEQQQAAQAKEPEFESALDLALDLGQALRIKGRGLDTLLRGTLKVTNPAGRLAVRGDVRTERGTYAAYSQKLVIDHGLLSFSGPLEDPRLDILALRPNLDVEVGVAVTGSALNPRVRLYSDPEMSDTDKLSWLVLGREPDGLGRADSALLQRAAMALLAGEGESPTDTFLANIGLSDFGVRQAGEGAEQTTVVSLGKQLTRRWYVGYERSVNATTGTWQLIYRIAQRFTLRAQSGEDSAVDLIWAWRWD
ncbi:MAG: translocation/assembly module TamB domain-containing protein [Pseudomonadota bacterium]